MKPVQREEINRAWPTLEAYIREAFRDWAMHRLAVADKAFLGSGLDGHSARLGWLANAAETPEQMAQAWSMSLDATSSIAKALYLSEVLRTGETLVGFIERVVRYMREEAVLGPVDRSPRRGREKKVNPWLSLALYGDSLPSRGIPKSIDLMVESALYALYVAASPRSKIILPDNRRELLRAVAVDEGALRVVTPRRFEELVAYVYEQLGCRAEITAATRDWGADILAWHPGPFGTESLIVVQTKLYSRQEKVTLSGVHGLHGAVAHYNANQGHLVATADLTGPAQQFMERVGYKVVDVSTLRRELSKLLD